MKKVALFSTLALVLLTFNSCKKEAVPEPGVDIISVSSDYKAVIWKYSATWCPPCGTYGFPAFHDAMANNPNTIVPIHIHPSDAIVQNESAEQTVIHDFFAWSGTPSAGFNADGQDFYPDADTYQSKIDAARTAHASATVGVGMTHKLEAGKLSIKTKTVFFQDVNATLNLAVYVVETDVIEDQAMSSGPTMTNAHFGPTFRGSANGAWGTQISTSSVKGTKIDGEYTFTIPSDVRNSDNLKVAAVIYRMVNGEPVEVVNANLY